MTQNNSEKVLYSKYSNFSNLSLHSEYWVLITGGEFYHVEGLLLPMLTF